MSDFSTQSSDQGQHSDVIDDDNFENDDIVTFQHDSKAINLYYSQLTKYSKHIRETYLFSDVKNRLPQEIHNFQEEYQLLSESVEYFFQLLQQNYNIKDDLNLTYIQCIDLLKMSKFLEVRKLSSKINQYIKTHTIDVDFIIQMIQYDIKTQTKSTNCQIKISSEIENLLSNKINECLTHEQFKELPIEIIYRITEQSSPDIINSNKLYDMIIKSLSKFCVLFPFLELQKLSEDRLSELCEIYSKSNENTIHYFDYLKCNLNLINEINKYKKNLEEMNDDQRNKMKDLEILFQKQMKDSESKNVQLQNQMDEQQKHLIESEKINAQLQNQLNEQQNKMKDLETKIELLQKHFDEQIQNQMNNYSKELENQISQLQEQIQNLGIIKGEIVASVEKGLIINAEIKLKENKSKLDTRKSKVIISTSDAKYLGSEAYEKGEPITSLHMNTTFACKPGRYYVRCIVFSSEGESNEIVSNSVTTSGNSLTFDYEGKAAKISLPQGQYKLEVWGAKGGNSTGKGFNHREGEKIVEGGLGGYSRGILNLNQQETVYVYVGEEGRPSNSSDGSITKGGFPDGGGTKTGHYSSFTTVPGTGGGSTSIRIGSDTNYARVIVAGGGGGASGSSDYLDPGGFGGGQSGGNCSYMESIKDQGAGTQTGSTRGLGECNDRHGDPGVFGSGATGKYCQTRDSGGGGGWYGGGSGGYGCSRWCSSGGGGSGWTFTESSMKTFQSGDSSNATKFSLTSTYYLTESVCIGGNEEFPRPDGKGNERGHKGNGYAKITLL